MFSLGEPYSYKRFICDVLKLIIGIFSIAQVDLWYLIFINSIYKVD